MADLDVDVVDVFDVFTVPVFFGRLDEVFDGLRDPLVFLAGAPEATDEGVAEAEEAEEEDDDCHRGCQHWVERELRVSVELEHFDDVGRIYVSCRVILDRVYDFTDESLSRCVLEEVVVSGQSPVVTDVAHRFVLCAKHVVYEH